MALLVRCGDSRGATSYEQRRLRPQFPYLGLAGVRLKDDVGTTPHKANSVGRLGGGSARMLSHTPCGAFAATICAFEELTRYRRTDLFTIKMIFDTR
jgi:hypothetical protein